MQPIQSCPMPEEHTGGLGLHKPPVPALLGNPCKMAASSHCQMVMTGNPPVLGQTSALQTIPAIQQRTRPDSTAQSTKCISISRPRPTALGTKTSVKVSRHTEPLLQVKATGTPNFLSHSPTESPLPYCSPQNPLSPASQLGFNPPTIPSTLPSPRSQPDHANTHNNLITRPIPNPNLSPPSNPVPQPIPSPEPHVPNTTEKKLNKTISEEGDFRWDLLYTLSIIVQQLGLVPLIRLSIYPKMPNWDFSLFVCALVRMFLFDLSVCCIVMPVGGNDDCLHG